MKIQKLYNKPINDHDDGPAIAGGDHYFALILENVWKVCYYSKNVFKVKENNYVYRFSHSILSRKHFTWVLDLKLLCAH